LKAADLPEQGTEGATIEKIRLEEIGRDRDQKPVIYFEEFSKGLVCNKTNARVIARGFGSEEFDDWIGQRILLYRAEVEFQGELVEAIRVKVKESVPAKKPGSLGEKKRVPPRGSGTMMQRLSERPVDPDAEEVPY